MNVPHPIPYQGSKRHLALEILRYFPHDARRLIEPFAGSAAVSLAAACYRRARSFTLNDINAPLMALWQKILFEPQTLSEEYRNLWQRQLGREREYYDMVRARFNDTHRPDDLLYLLARCVKASVRYNALGEFNQSPDNRRRGMRPETMSKHISGAAQLLAGKTEVMCGDYQSALQRATPADVIYMDPPYQGVSGRRDMRYMQGLAFSDFVETLSELNRKQLSYLVSYDGRTGAKRHGQLLPSGLNLIRVEFAAGVSSQATLLGRRAKTYEALYLSPALARRLKLIKAGVNPLPNLRLPATLPNPCVRKPADVPFENRISSNAAQ